MENFKKPKRVYSNSDLDLSVYGSGVFWDVKYIDNDNDSIECISLFKSSNFGSKSVFSPEFALSIKISAIFAFCSIFHSFPLNLPSAVALC